MSNAASINRRRAPRTQLLLKVEYDTAGDLLADYLTDLSSGGLFIRTSRSFDIGEEIDFALSFPGLLEPMQVSGIVRWRRESGEKNGKVPGVGVEFVFPDSSYREDLESLLSRLDAEAKPAPQLDNGAFRVLLVEDNPFAHNLFLHAVKRFHRALNGNGILQVVSAHDGQEALEKLRERPVDLAIVDFFLPIMDGAELIRRVRKLPEVAATPILVISSGGEGVREKALRAGADLYLDKPVLLKQLLSTLQILLSHRAEK